MREYILAMRAIWASWNEGEKLFFRGEFYRHTLMTPFFSPAPHEYGPPKVFLAAVGELMTEVAGEVADGLLVHPFTTERYLREVTMPALERGLGEVGPIRARTCRSPSPAWWSPRIRRARGPRGEFRGAQADRLLRFDAGLPGRARPVGLGRFAAAAQRTLSGGRVGRDGATSSMTMSSTLSASLRRSTRWRIASPSVSATSSTASDSMKMS